MSNDLKKKILDEFDFTHIALVVSVMVTFFSFMVQLNLYFKVSEQMDKFNYAYEQSIQGERFTMDNGKELCELKENLTFCKD